MIRRIVSAVVQLRRAYPSARSLLHAIELAAEEPTRRETDIAAAASAADRKAREECLPSFNATKSAIDAWTNALSPWIANKLADDLTFPAIEGWSMRQIAPGSGRYIVIADGAPIEGGRWAGLCYAWGRALTHLKSLEVRLRECQATLRAREAALLEGAAATASTFVTEARENKEEIDRLAGVVAVFAMRLREAGVEQAEIDQLMGETTSAVETMRAAEQDHAQAHAVTCACDHAPSLHPTRKDGYARCSGDDNTCKCAVTQEDFANAR